MTEDQIFWLIRRIAERESDGMLTPLDYPFSRVSIHHQSVNIGDGLIDYDADIRNLRWTFTYSFGAKFIERAKGNLPLGPAGSYGWWAVQVKIHHDGLREYIIWDTTRQVWSLKSALKKYNVKWHDFERVIMELTTPLDMIKMKKI